MKKKRSRIIKIVAVVLLIGSALFIGGRYFVFYKIKQGVLAQIDSLRTNGTVVQYDSLYTSVWRNAVGVTKLQVRFPANQTNCKDTATTQVALIKAEIHGISLLSLILKKQIHVSRIEITGADVRYIRISHHTKKHKPDGDGKIKGVLIDHILFSSAKVGMLDSATCGYTAKMAMDFEISGLELTDPGKESMALAVRDFTLASLNMQFPKKFYTITVGRFAYGAAGKTLRVDSINVTPQYDKTVFAEKTKEQTDRITCSIPTIEATGVELGTSLKDPSFQIGNVSLNFKIEVYRDKRFPVVYHKLRVLPVSFLHSLPVAFHIDSINLLKSHVLYEEMPENGGIPGRIQFADLTATIKNVGNQNTENTHMNTRAKFMNTGLLQAQFMFPADPGKAYTVTGSLSNFNLPDINPMLMPIANAEIKSGSLNEMAFHYQYNDFRSDGELTMDYKHLEVASLTKSSKKDKSTNKFVTLLLNSFIVKKEMTKNDRKGTIIFYRDNHKAIFNYWWKSILSGVKELYNLDRVMDIEGKKKKK